MQSLLTFITGLLVPIAQAQQHPWVKYAAPMGGLGSGRQFVNEFSIRVANFFLIIFTGSVVIAMMYGAFMMIISGGNQEGKEKAKKVFMFAVIGLVLAVIGHAILAFVGSQVAIIVA